ncbi:MAG: adenylyltransferase/cytidyltransferase family protein [Lachnospiraceae bacterium]|nr:adenylyltransferase/cytidyltransferase family protein [Lachnospiraceae bacterium]
MNQLDALGIREYSIFDPAKAYVRKRHPINTESALAFENSTVPAGGKKYHVGYIAGVFDLYHIGHLNMFRHAKEMCDYLIVGVVSDEGVKRFKKVQTFVPFEERIEMVRSCRYVDEAVEIPYLFNGSQDAWRMHHFDVQFSGSDYQNDPGFENYKKFLEEHGATLEFFPYTQSTSSTQLRALIEKKLI